MNYASSAAVFEGSSCTWKTRDCYGTETELPHLAKWRRGEPDDYGWLEWWLETNTNVKQRRSTSRAFAQVVAGVGFEST